MGYNYDYKWFINYNCGYNYDSEWLINYNYGYNYDYKWLITMVINHLSGGLEHGWIIFPNQIGDDDPSPDFHIFFRGVGIPPTS